MPYISKDKCVYKKGSKKKVGCTKGSVKRYLRALHANVVNETIQDDLTSKYEGCLELELTEDNVSIILNKIFINKNCRDQGKAKSVMKDLGEYADKTNKTIYLKTSGQYDSDINKLAQFYKQFGFKMIDKNNDNTDFNMIRPNLKLGQKRINEASKNNTDFSKKIEKGKEALLAFLTNKKAQVSNVYKSLTSGKKLTEVEMKELKTLAKEIGQTAIFLLPGGSIPYFAYKIYVKHKEKNNIKNKGKNPEEIKEPEEIMENKLVGGRADNETIKDMAKKFRVPVKYLKQQLEKGMKVESEHTDDEEKQKEIAEDHLAEFPNYYIKLSEMEDELKDYWKDKLKNDENMNESKILIKKLLRENISKMTNMSPEMQKALQTELDRLGLKLNDVNVIIDDKIQNEGLGSEVRKRFSSLKQAVDAVAKPLIVCGALVTAAGTLGCKAKQQYVYKFSYNIDKLVTYTLKEDTKLPNNLILKAGQQFGIMDGEVYNPKDNSKLPEHMQKEIFDFIKNNPDSFTNNSGGQYKPQEQVGSWYELEDHILPEPERQAMEDKLAAQEEVRLVGKGSDYTIVDSTTLLKLQGPSKRGDIETTNGN